MVKFYINSFSSSYSSYDDFLDYLDNFAVTCFANRDAFTNVDKDIVFTIDHNSFSISLGHED